MSDFTSDPFQDKPWMYSMPKGKQLKIKWLITWKNVLLEIAEIQNIQLINKLDLRNKGPLNRLDQASYEILIKSLQETGEVSYWGNGNLRIYWKSISGWAEHLYEKAQNLDKNILFGTDSAQEIDPRMKRIPSKDLIRIFKRLVDSGKGRWVEEHNNILKLL